MVDHAALTLGAARRAHFSDNLRQRRGCALDRAGERVATQGAKAHHARAHLFARLQRQALVVAHDQRAIALHHGARRCEIKRHDGDILLQDIIPHIRFGPIGQGKHAETFAGLLARVVKAPGLRPLVLRIPAMLRRAQRKHAFLGAGFLFIAPRAAKGRVEFIKIQRLLQPLRLHHIRMQPRARRDGANARAHALLIDVDDQVEAQLFRALVAEGDHLPELPGRVHMQQREWRIGGIEGLHRQMQQHGGILADGIEDHRPLAGGRHLAKDMDAFGL